MALTFSGTDYITPRRNQKRDSWFVFVTDCCWRRAKTANDGTVEESYKKTTTEKMLGGEDLFRKMRVPSSRSFSFPSSSPMTVTRLGIGEKRRASNSSIFRRHNLTPPSNWFSSLFSSGSSTFKNGFGQTYGSGETEEGAEIHCLHLLSPVYFFFPGKRKSKLNATFRRQFRFHFVEIRFAFDVITWIEDKTRFLSLRQAAYATTVAKTDASHKNQNEANTWSFLKKRFLQKRHSYGFTPLCLIRWRCMLAWKQNIDKPTIESEDEKWETGN